MTLRDELLPTVYEARAIAGELGFRMHRVYLVTSVSSGTYVGDGDRDDTVTEIVEDAGQPPRIRWLKDEELALGGGLPRGTVEIGPITPAFTGGGTDLSSLDGSNLETGDVRLLRIVGPTHPNGADYRVHALTSDRALRYMIQALPAGLQAS